MARFGAVAVLVYAGASLVVVISGLASNRPERVAELPLSIWLGAFCAILLGSAAAALWLSPRPASRSWALYSLAVILVAWLPCAGMFVLLLKMADVYWEEFRFSSVLREVRHLDPDKALLRQSQDGLNAQAGFAHPLHGPGLVVVREGAHGNSMTAWSGTVGRIEQRADKVAELATVVVIYRIDDTLAYAVIDWPHRRTVEWSLWKDTPNKYVDRTCNGKGHPYPCVALIGGGPQWGPLLDRLGYYKPPHSIQGSTLINLAVLYVIGLVVLLGVGAVFEARHPELPARSPR